MKEVGQGHNKISTGMQVKFLVLYNMYKTLLG